MRAGSSSCMHRLCLVASELCRAQRSKAAAYGIGKWLIFWRQRRADQRKGVWWENLEEAVMSKCSMKCSVGKPQCMAGTRPFISLYGCWLWTVALACPFCIFSSPVWQMSSPDCEGPYFDLVYLGGNEREVAQAATLNR